MSTKILCRQINQWKNSFEQVSLSLYELLGGLKSYLKFSAELSNHFSTTSNKKLQYL